MSTKKTTQLEQIFRKAERVNSQINVKLEEIKYWREFSTKTGIIFDEVKSGGTRKNRSKIEESVCKITDIENALKKDMNELIELKETAMRIIDRIDEPEYRFLLIQRYLYGKKWDDVAEVMGYSYGHLVHRMHPRAIEKLKALEAEN